jgi:uncharacterized membrane protein
MKVDYACRANGGQIAVAPADRRGYFTARAMENSNDTARLEAFSDGVFSIAITLLAFNLKIPSPAGYPAHWSLGRALLSQWPTYLAFITSFVTILIMWVNHHRLFRLIEKRINRCLF